MYQWYFFCEIIIYTQNILSMTFLFDSKAYLVIMSLQSYKTLMYNIMTAINFFFKY